MLSVRDPFTCVHNSAHAHTQLCSSVYIGHGLFRTKKKSKVVLMIFLTLLLSHSLFLFSFPVLSPSCPLWLLYMLSSLFLLILSYSSSVLTPRLYDVLPSLCSRNISTRNDFFSLILSLVFYLCFLLSVPPLSCLLRFCVGFHSVLSSFQSGFVKERKSVIEISIALLLFQEKLRHSRGLLWMPILCLASISHSFSLFLWWTVGSCTTVLTNCLT